MRRTGPWSASEVERFLVETRAPMRLAANGAHGHPLLLSLWFVRAEERLWCATQRRSRLASLLARDSRCASLVSWDYRERMSAD